MVALSSFFNAEQNANRVSRACAFVVHVELPNWRGSGQFGFEELDADDYQHARILAASWVNRHGATSAAIRKVEPKGAIPKVLEYLNPGDAA
jgi:hypothetical protein